MKFFPDEFKRRKHAIMFLTESCAAAMHYGLLFLSETHKAASLSLCLALCHALSLSLALSFSHSVCDRTPATE